MSHLWSFFTKLSAKLAQRVRQAEVPTDRLAGAVPPILAGRVRRIEEEEGEAVANVEIEAELTPAMRTAIAKQLTNFLLQSGANIPPEEIPVLQQQIQANAFAGYRSDRMSKILRADFGLAQEMAARVSAHAASLVMSKHREQRAREVGCTRYKWSTSHDERVCPRCRALGGKIFTWDNPPEGGHPGECECWRLVCPERDY